MGHAFLGERYLEAYKSIWNRHLDDKESQMLLWSKITSASVVIPSTCLL